VSGRPVLGNSPGKSAGLLSCQSGWTLHPEPACCAPGRRGSACGGPAAMAGAGTRSTPHWTARKADSADLVWDGIHPEIQDTAGGQSSDRRPRITARFAL